MILGIETATSLLSVALIDKGSVLGVLEHEHPNAHDELLAPKCHELLTRHAVTPAQLTGVAVSAGPGSFTGLRIGMAMAKGMALALSIPIAAVPTLDSLAFAAAVELDSDEIQRLLVVLASRKDEAYAATYELKKQEWSVLSPVSVMSFAIAAAMAPEVNYVTGNAAELLPAVASADHIMHLANISPRAQHIGLLGEQMLKRGEAADTESCEPIYVQDFEVKQAKNALFRTTE